ncbi:chloramphenicol acetyltransferase [Flavobacterium sp. J49]|uniref:CatA-like O-acetyltransferase n=1 Tax=Flavobacterium sp. J49 TaxID=2718534 RepID=UPI00159311DE|nr:chloramphenicol acetyltransferase [Flavobacterium sp. J49]MBF6641570.1 chloramphenicol acetyltransferase [Flavobacterium sp. J49]NIC02817.1 chloramphenicol acetyltransferase [Flavobacterium sp. J49]
MKQLLNLDTWSRKEHFLFFKQMEEPFFGITTRVDCTKAYVKAKELGVSFFTYYLHKTLIAVNALENFRYRIIEDKVYVFDQIDVSATILRDDKTFGFSLMEYNKDLNTFAEITRKEIARIQITPGLITRDFEINLIHFSAVPWVDFTSYSHARSFTWPDSCPKISYGKMVEENGKKTMSISVHVHHGLVDGYHVGQFLTLLQELLNE